MLAGFGFVGILGGNLDVLPVRLGPGILDGLASLPQEDGRARCAAEDGQSPRQLEEPALLLGLGVGEGCCRGRLNGLGLGLEIALGRAGGVDGCTGDALGLGDVVGDGLVFRLSCELGSLGGLGGDPLLALMGELLGLCCQVGGDRTDLLGGLARDGDAISLILRVIELHLLL